MSNGARKGLGAKRKSKRNRVRDAHLRRRYSRQPREAREQLREAEVLATEDIFLADAPALCREEMPARAIFHANQVQSSVEIRRHPAIQEIHNHPPGRRRLVIERTDWRRGIHDHDRRARSSRILGHAFGQELRSLVGTHHRIDSNRGVFAARGAVRNSERADGAGMDDARDAGFACGPDHVARALDVDRVHRRVIDDPQPIVGGNMVNLIASFGGPADRVDIANVAPHDLAIDFSQRRGVGILTRQRAHPIASRDQRADDVTSEKSIRAGNKRGPGRHQISLALCGCRDDLGRAARNRRRGGAARDHRALDCCRKTGLHPVAGEEQIRNRRLGSGTKPIRVGRGRHGRVLFFHHQRAHQVRF